MQRVSSMLPSWDKTKTGSKKGFDKAWGWADKLGAPVNRLSNKIGSEAFWPTTLDKESDKAARILKSFCKDGFYAEEDRPATVDVPKGKQRVLKKIPEKVIQNAVGLAIFTTMRTGLWVSGAGGSGVLIARKEDGSWSPPSGILLHTAGLGFLVGVDIYDCVVVINNRKALDAFTKIRATLGGEISAVAGPVGVGGVLENDGKWKQANRPVFTYLKSRGFYAGVQVDGTVIIERNDENERFYGERIGVADILAGKARHPPYEIKMLMETVKAAEGRSDVDVGMMLELADQPAPGDVDVEAPGSATSTSFGIPEPDDPDPFGVLALEKAGLDIKEAGTKSRPVSSAVFEYNPSPTSPIYGRFHRRSMDTLATRSNRESYMSTRSSRTTYRTSIDRATQTMEMGTQTDDASTPNTSPSHSDEDKRIVEEDDEKHAVVVPESEPVDYTKIDMGEFENMGRDRDVDGPIMNDSPRERADSDTRAAATMDDSFHTDDDDELDEEEPVIYEAASAQATVVAPQAINARGGIVNIAKRPPPPPLPPRSVARGSHILMVDQASGRTPTSPAKEGFEQVAVHGNDRSSKDLGRSSKELENGITMEDLEDMEDRFSKIESVRISTPIIIEPESGNRFKTDSSGAPEAAGSKLSKDEDETDDFHSVPTTPLEANTNGTRI